jgi:hypothetical protein
MSSEKRDRIISKVKAKYWSKTHKFGIRMPKSVKEALQINASTGTNFWRKAINKEMKNVMVAFEYVEAEDLEEDSEHINCHMIFDINGPHQEGKACGWRPHNTTSPKREHVF